MKVFGIYLLIQYIGILIFFKGFFPYSQSNTMYTKKNNSQNPPIKKVVLFIIDALRADMIFSKDSSHLRSNWPYLYQLMLKGYTKCNIANLQSPTVTLPRIKALTTGSIPGFLDVVFNFNSPELMEDNILYHLNQSGWRLAMAGDDTWLRLFPNYFTFMRPTTSFFVNDFYEVDLNVTMELPRLFSLQEDNGTRLDSWQFLVLHYLGLDHIGHVEGPFSKKVNPKLKEMDSALKMVVDGLLKSSTSDWLVVVTGDHGMSDYGGHGGASSSEVTTAVLSISEKFQSLTKESLHSSCTTRSEYIEQIDLATTLSLLTGCSIPTGSRGVFIPNLLSLLESYKERIDTLLVNLKHFNEANLMTSDELSELSLIEERISESSDCYMSSFASVQCQVFYRSTKSMLYRLLSSVQSRSARSSTEFDLLSMSLGMMLLFVSLLGSLYTICTWNTPVQVTGRGNMVLPLFFITILLILQYYTEWLQGIPFVFVILFFIFAVVKLRRANLISFLFHSKILMKYFSEFNQTFCCILIGGIVLHAFSQSSSSFVEEEHQVWYYFTCSVHILLSCYFALKFFKCINADALWSSASLKSIWNDVKLNFNLNALLSILTVAILDRFLRCLNQTGDKWSHLPDVADWITAPSNEYVLQSLGIISICVITICLHASHLIHRNILTLICLVLVAIFKLFAGFLSPRGVSSVELAQFCYILVLIDLVVNCITKSLDVSSQILRSVTLLIVILSRPCNLILWACMLCKEKLISTVALRTCRRSSSSVSWYCWTLLYHYYGMTAFYNQGNSHSLATVDVASAYTGLSDFNPFVTGFLLAVNTFSGPLFWLAVNFKYFTSIKLDTQKLKSELKEYNSRSISHYISSEAWCLVILALHSFPISLFTAICCSLRYHLFVWTVFSPKLLYFGSQLLVATPFLLIYSALL